MNQKSQELTVQLAISRTKKVAQRGKIVEAVEIYTAILQKQSNQPFTKKRYASCRKNCHNINS